MLKKVPTNGNTNPNGVYHIFHYMTKERMKMSVMNVNIVRIYIHYNIRMVLMV